MSSSKKGNRLTLQFATANFPEDYLPYTATYSRNSGHKDPYLVWDSGFHNADAQSDGHYGPHHTQTTASLDSHSPASLNHHYHYQASHNHLYPTCSASSGSWPSAKKRKCCGISCGCCWLTICALTIISALAVIVGFSIYLAMITNLHTKSAPYVMNGSFKVDSGDAFHMKLINISSPEFQRKANKYETIIKTAFETSPMTEAITKQEVYAFRKGSLLVFFKLYLDRRKFDNIMDSESGFAARSSIDNNSENSDKSNSIAPFDDSMAAKLLQKDLRDGISQLKITGTEQIIIDLKSIKVMNDYLNSVTDNNNNNVNDIKTGGFAATKPMAPIKAKDIKHLMSNKSSDIKPKQDNDSYNRGENPAMNITNTTQPTLSIGLKKTTATGERPTEPDVRNASPDTHQPTNTGNTRPIVVVSTHSVQTTTHSSPISSTQSSASSSTLTAYKETEIFTSSKPISPEIVKSTPIPQPKTEHRNPFLPFTRRQSTTPSVTPSSTSTTNIRITTRSRVRSTTSTTTLTSTTPLPPTPPPPPPSPATVDPTNVLIKRNDLKDDILRVSGMDFSDWKPVSSKPPSPKPLPAKPIPPPIYAPNQPLQPPNHQMPPNLGPFLRPQQSPAQPLPPQPLPPPLRTPNRPRLRIPLPIGIPMREVPRLLDTDEDDENNNNNNEEYPGVTPKVIESHNTSISHGLTRTTTTTPMPTTFQTSGSPGSQSPTRSPRLSSSTTADPSMVDGFMVPMTAIEPFPPVPHPPTADKTDLNDYNRDLRRNKSLNVLSLNANPITGDQRDTERDYYRPSSVATISLTNDVVTSSSLPTTTRVKDLSIGSPVLYFSKPSKTIKTEEKAKPLGSNDLVTKNMTKNAKQTPNNSSESPTIELNASLTKSPFDYFNAINETLFSSNPVIEVTPNTTSSVIISSDHQIMRDINSSNDNLRRVVSETTPVPEMIPGLPLGLDKSDQLAPEKLIRPFTGSGEPVYGERLPKYIPPALYQKYPNNDIVNPDSVPEEIGDEALYDDEIAAGLNHSLTTSHWSETTTAAALTVSTRCADNEFECLTSGECIPAKGHCNRRVECRDGSDESRCTCAQYLRAERQFKKICDGVIDCYDMSDEMDCSYCTGNYVCPQSNVCIDKSKVCNGDNDCPNGDDESECISLVPNDQMLDKTGRYYNSEGALYIRQKGKWAPLCLDDININNDLDIVRRSDDLWKIEDLGKAICRANSYADLNTIQLTSLANYHSNEFFKMEPFNDRISPSLSMWSSLFEKSECQSKRTTYVKCKNFECGVRPVTNGIRRRIVGGQSSSQGSWPWQVALYREGEFQCGGVIIDGQWLLTAAHCFHATREAYWTARFGILRRGNVFASPYEQIRRITHVIVHKDYVDKGFINDIALLRLNEPINYSKHVRPVCMPTESEDVSKWHRQLCTTVGWGKLFEHGRIFPDTLQEVKLPVISTEECRKRTLFLPLYKITDNMFCAGYDRGGRDACLGDSGGPLMCQKRNGKWFLLGVTSNGDGCGRAGRPGVYTKVAKYGDWIDSVINNHLEPELNRPCDGLRCPLGRCLRKEHICNGIIDCRDGSDEQNCMDFSNKKSVNNSNNTSEANT